MSALSSYPVHPPISRCPGLTGRLRSLAPRERLTAFRGLSIADLQPATQPDERSRLPALSRRHQAANAERQIGAPAQPRLQAHDAVTDAAGAPGRLHRGLYQAFRLRFGCRWAQAVQLLGQPEGRE